MTKKLIILFLFITVLIAGCSSQTTSNIEDKPTISTIFSPVEEITKNIVGNQANVNLVVPRGTDPHSYEPTPNQIVTFSNSEVFVTMGGMFEHIEEDIISSNTDIKLIDSTHDIDKIGDSHEDEHSDEENSEEHNENNNLSVNYHEEHNELEFSLDIMLPNPCYAVLEELNYNQENLIINLTTKYNASPDTMCTQAVVDTRYESEIELSQEIDELKIILNNEEMFHRDIHDISNEEHHDEAHKEESQEEHGHEEHEDYDYDPHVWLSVHNMIDMTKEVSEELSNNYPQNSELFTQNAQTYITKLEELEEKYEETLSSCEFDKIIVNHKSFGYIAEDFGFEQISVAGFSPESEPTPQTIQNVIQKARDYNLTYVFSEGQLDSRVAQTIANDIEGEVLELNPITLTSEQTYIELMEENLVSLAKGLNCN